MNSKNKTWLIILVIIEILIFVWGYFSESYINEAIRISARYSARLSALVYLYCFYLFTLGLIKNTNKIDLNNWISIFCVVHLIHFCFLAANVYLNKIELIPYKLAGGFLAYLMIISFPFLVKKPNLAKWTYFVYFYYVGIVFIITYISRIKGQFIGAEPSIFHYIGLIAIAIFFIANPIIIFTKGKELGEEK